MIFIDRALDVAVRSYHVPRMSPRESKTVDLALLILRTTFENRYEKAARTPAVRLALRVLLPYVGRHPLMAFWRIMDNDNPLQRLNHLEKEYRGIEARVMGARTRRGVSGRGAG